MTWEERARRGGLAVVKRYGNKHMAAIGRKGFDAAIQALRHRSANRPPLAQAEVEAWLYFRIGSWYIGDKRNGGRCLSRAEWRQRRR